VFYRCYFVYRGFVLSEDQYDELSCMLLADIRALVPLIFPYRKPISEAHIRMAAAIMRRWLVDGDLKTLLSPLRQTALFSVQGNAQVKTYADRSSAFRYYLTAGIMANGRPIRHIYESEFPPDKIDQSLLSEGCVRLPLKKFLAQPRLFYQGRWFNTEQILRFVANKLGGNHLDFDRTGEWERLDAANAFMRYGGPDLATAPVGSELYLILEPDSDEVIGGVHLEVIAAAAAFVQMEIGGVQLCNLSSEKGLLGWLRQKFRSPVAPRLIE
jgi:hypothetical protein